MTQQPARFARGILEAPFRTPRAPLVLGRSLWLYLHLVLVADSCGLVIRTRSRIAGELSAREDEIDSWVTRLSEAQLIRLLSPSPYLAIRLRFWSGDSRAIFGRTDEASHKRNSYSSAAARALSGCPGERGRGEGEKHRDEIRALLPEADAAEIARITEQYPSVVIRKAIDRVNGTPAGKIRKSKTALFRYLLATFSQEIDVREL